MSVSRSQRIYRSAWCLLFGAMCSFLLSAATSLYTLSNEAVGSVGWRSFADITYLYGVGEVDQRWTLDHERLSFGVSVGKLDDWSGIDSRGSFMSEERVQIKDQFSWSLAHSQPSSNGIGTRVYEYAAGFPFRSWIGQVREDSIQQTSTSWFCIVLYQGRNVRYPPSDTLRCNSSPVRVSSSAARHR